MNFYSQFKDQISYQLNAGKQVLNKLRFGRMRKPFVASEIVFSTEMIPTPGEIYEDQSFVGQYPTGLEYSEIPSLDLDLGIGRTSAERIEPSALDEILVNPQMEITDAINAATGQIPLEEIANPQEEINPEPLPTIDDIFKPLF